MSTAARRTPVATIDRIREREQEVTGTTFCYIGGHYRPSAEVRKVRDVKGQLRNACEACIEKRRAHRAKAKARAAQ